MVLRIQIALLLTIFTGQLFADNTLKLFYTDKYDSNFFSSTENLNTKIHIGSNMFRFVSNEQIHICKMFIDSFLRIEEIASNNEIVFSYSNTLEVELINVNAIKCKNISEIWFEKYNIAWIKLLKKLIKLENIQEGQADLMILKKLYIDERSRLFHVSNIINNTLFAFVIPSSLSSNDFKKSQTVLNTKRYTSHEPEISYTEIIYSDKKKKDDIILKTPSANKHSFLKNCISLYILKDLGNGSEIIDIDYQIAQTILSSKFLTDSNTIHKFQFQFKNTDLSKTEFNELKTKAINSILESINEQNLFFYSYYDILKLKQMRHLYEADNLTRQIELLQDKTKFIVELSKENPYSFKTIKLVDIHKTDFDRAFIFKANSIDFKNDNDTLIFKKLNLFLKLNENYDLTINSYSRQSEYLFVEKSKKEAIIEKYKKVNHSISYSKKLKLYRSLVIFAKLTDLNIKANRIKCIGLRGKNPIVEFEFSKKD